MPKPFRFRLEKVLEFRRQREDQAKAALAEAQRLYQVQVEVTDRARRLLDDFRMTSLGKTFTAAEMWLRRQYGQRLEEELADAEVRLKRLALNLQQRRAEAVSASRDRKLLEKLKEKQAERYYDEQALKEQKEFDEMATIRFEPENL